MGMTKPWMLAFASVLLLSETAHADKAVLFNPEVVNTPEETANAVTLVLARHMESRGIPIVLEKDLNGALTKVPTVETLPSTVEPAEASRPAQASGAAGPAEASAAESSSSPAAPAEPPVEQRATPSLSVLATGAGCRFYMTGSIVTLGEQMTLTLDLFLNDGARVAGKKITALNAEMLPLAVETLAAAAADEMNRFAEAHPTASAASPQGGPLASDGPDTASMRPKSNEGFQKNFGILVGQTFSISKKDMFNFLSFYFNARLEFNRLLMNTNVGFSLGNKDPGDAFHFLFNLSLSAYLLKTQVTPYVGGGAGFFVGNRMRECRTDYYGGEVCTSGDARVGWDVFPVLGLEVLRTLFLRVHLEGRYLVTFNGYGSWGHGPAILMGVAF